MRVFILALFFLITAATSLLAQQDKLAQQYYLNGEFEKAASLYERLYRQNEANDFYLSRYVDCLVQLQEFDKGATMLQKEIKKSPDKLQLYVMYGSLLERRNDLDEATKQYQLAIKRLPADRYQIQRLAQEFTRTTKYEQAIATYEKGAELLKDPVVFAYNLAELYRLENNAPKMVENYLNSLDASSGRMSTLQSIFQRFFGDAEYDELQQQLFLRLQSDPENTPLTELLAWVFMQKKDYRNALRQYTALDRRLNENGGRVHRLGEIAANDKAYGVAIQAFEYIQKEKGPNSPYYVDSKRRLLATRRNQITEAYQYEREDLTALEEEYTRFLNEFGRTRATASIILEFSELQALYLNDLDQAIATLESLIALPGVTAPVLAEAKLNLGDYYLMQGDPWEATLLYSQVDKSFTEDVLGHEARFRNARLAYFNGDFEWAQAQCEVLKASTSKLIANDALDLSIFIMDNLGLDTTAESLMLYAEAELLVFQNRFSEAFLKLDTLLKKFPKHSLEDDVYYLKSKVYQKKQNFEAAADMLQRIVDEHLEGIRGDDALFRLAELHETQLQNPDKARELYERLFIELSGSTFAVEARKRYRRLRGDAL
jgi:tetratricopeptide (TPR) repeat protein